MSRRRSGHTRRLSAAARQDRELQRGQSQGASNWLWIGHLNAPQTAPDPRWMSPDFEFSRSPSLTPETGERLASYPADINILDCAKAVYHDMPGWNRPTNDATTYYELAKNS
ncbi:hypothetical protein S40285_10744 [Stachybotrys chlorohalonatus IBT 40285]|uniref:Uncharacterized protein n=1 Tax=Stachybotrys chlorohalonatus (strain IBT 40285) TaxID=1283841 RepID=A0A084QWJ4_STAC4|nr:hypothetical protein S40285_10744 [Stachybotrys chlorohalonata IBT 40285]